MTDTVNPSVDRPSPLFAPKTPKRPGDLPSGSGEGMDRKVKKRWLTPRNIALGGGALLLLALLGYALSTTRGGSRLNVERDKLTIHPVSEGAYQEYINVTGSVAPRNTVYLDAVEGGRVEEVFVREGALVNAGDPLLRLSNSDLQLRLLTNEAYLTEQENNLSNMRSQIEQTRLTMAQQLLQMEYEVQRLRRELDRNQALYEKKLVSQQEFERLRDEHQYWVNRMNLTQLSYRSDSLAQETRVQQMQQSVQRMRLNFSILQQTLENLTVRAPVSGHLTMLDAEIGELRPSGSRFGQIDVLDGGYKVRAAIDEFYIARVQRGQTASTQPIGGETYRMAVTRVYPEVRDGRFEVDLDFQGEVPADFRRGQTVRLNLELGDPAEALLLPRGGFYQSTGGNWVYVVDPSGGFAAKRPIRIGRQNPQHYEVLEGLRPGDQVVTSSYETFGDADRLVFE